MDRQTVMPIHPSQRFLLIRENLETGGASNRRLHGNTLDQNSRQVILLRRASGEANDRLIKLSDDDFWIAIAEFEQDFGQTIGSEGLLP